MEEEGDRGAEAAVICPEHRWPSEDPVQALRGAPQLLPQAHCPCGGSLSTKNSGLESKTFKQVHLITAPKSLQRKNELLSMIPS